MRFKHVRFVVVVVVFILVLESISTSKSRPNKYIKRSNHETEPVSASLGQSSSSEAVDNEKTFYENSATKTLSYHRSLVPDMSFASQIEDMPTEEKIVMPSITSADANYNTKKDTVARALNQYVASDLAQLNQPYSSDYSGWTTAKEQPAALFSPDINNYNSTTANATDAEYPAMKANALKNQSTNSIHISQFSCQKIQLIMCMYEQVSLLCPSQCQQPNDGNNNHTGNATANHNVPRVNSSQQTPDSARTEATKSSDFSPPNLNASHHHSPSDSNYENFSTTTTSQPNNSLLTGEELVGVYVKYDEQMSIDNVMSNSTNYTTPISNNSIQSVENVPEPPINITYPSQLKAMQNDTGPYTQQKQNQVYPANERSFTMVEPATSSYIASPIDDNTQLRDALTDSFYVLAGIVDRSTKGFYMENMERPSGQPFADKDNSTVTEAPSEKNQTDHIHSTTAPPTNPPKNNSDPAECSTYKVDQCVQLEIRKLCPNLCKTCSPWIPLTNCSAVCGIGLQNMTRECEFSNGTIVREDTSYTCEKAPCNAICQILTRWGPCLKPVDGVSVRAKNCTFADGTSRIYYEHRACNDKNTLTTPKKQHIPSSLAAYLSFDKFRDDINVIYDEQVDSNDLNVLNVKLFDGNFTCGFGALLTQHDSIMVFNDNVFRNFLNKTFSILAWIFPKSGGGHLENRPQTLLQLISNENNFGSHLLELTKDGLLRWTHFNSEGKIVFAKKSTMKIGRDSWVHIALVYAENPLSAVIYIDSIPSTVESNGVYLTSVNTQLKKKTVGVFQAIGNNINLNQPFYGVIDEIFIFNKPINSNLITNTADTCRYRVGRGCPSPLLGFCPDCPSCTNSEVLPKDDNYDFDQNTPYTPINPPVIS